MQHGLCPLFFWVMLRYDLACWWGKKMENFIYFTRDDELIIEGTENIIREGWKMLSLGVHTNSVVVSWLLSIWWPSSRNFRPMRPLKKKKYRLVCTLPCYLASSVVSQFGSVRLVWFGTRCISLPEKGFSLVCSSLQSECDYLTCYFHPTAHSGRFWDVFLPKSYPS